MRTAAQVFEDQHITLADAVKAARLNCEHMPTSIEHGAQLIGEVLTANADEVRAIVRAILAAVEA